MIVSDFARIRLYDLDTGTRDEFALKDLYRHIKLFWFAAGHTPQKIEAQDPSQPQGGGAHGQAPRPSAGFRLHRGHQSRDAACRRRCSSACLQTTRPSSSLAGLSVNSSRTSPKRTAPDLGQQLSMLFQVLNTQEERRQKSLDEVLAGFPYVNGKLFQEALPIPSTRPRCAGFCSTAAALIGAAVRRPFFGAVFQTRDGRGEGSARRREPRRPLHKRREHSEANQAAVPR
ncbi:MAG: hypothetical protein MZV70_58915 [Desulfobacterales bacterium]|nr:hypothetical protein [Desulfobacterales bacterium]